MRNYKFDPFQYEHLFYQYKLKILPDEINQILLLTKNLNSKDMKTTYQYLNILNFPILKNLKKQITNILDKHKLLLTDNWSQFYNRTNKHPIHNHYGSVYSGIIYLLGKNPSSTVFYDSHYQTYNNEFKKDTLLMFPSMTPHEVKPLKKNEERLIISFNTRRN